MIYSQNTSRFRSACAIVPLDRANSFACSVCVFTATVVKSDFLTISIKSDVFHGNVLVDDLLNAQLSEHANVLQLQVSRIFTFRRDLIPIRSDELGILHQLNIT